MGAPQPIPDSELTVALTRRAQAREPQITLLLVEDDDAEARRIAAALSQPPFGHLVGCERVRTLSGALVALEMKRYRCVLADTRLPDASGPSVMRMLAERAPDTAIIALTPYDKDPLIGELLRSGARQYLVKGLYDARRTLVVIAHAIERNLRSVAAARAQGQTYERLARDPLTGLHSRGLMRDIGDYAVGVARRSQGQLALCCIDIDGFRRANERLGRETADAVLCAVADVLRRCVRDEDAVSRQQGDEFLVLLGPKVLASECERVARRIAEGVQGLRFDAAPELRLSACVGLARYPQDADGYEPLLLNAELAMLEAKRSGAAQTRFYSLALRGGSG